MPLVSSASLRFERCPHPSPAHVRSSPRCLPDCQPALDGCLILGALRRWKRSNSLPGGGDQRGSAKYLQPRHPPPLHRPLHPTSLSLVWNKRCRSHPNGRPPPSCLSAISLDKSRISSWWDRFVFALLLDITFHLIVSAGRAGTKITEETAVYSAQRQKLSALSHASFENVQMI